MPKQRRGCSQLWRSLCCTALLLAAARSTQGLNTQPIFEIAPLTPGSRPEGVTAGSSSDLWVACLSGRLLHVDLLTNSTTVVHQEPGVALSGAKFCPKQQILFAAGSLTGNGYMFHMQKASSSSTGQQQYTVVRREVVKLYIKPGLAYINDVALSNDSVYFTDSFHPTIYSVSRYHNSSSDRSVMRYNTGRYFDTKLGQFRANGLAIHSSSEEKDTLMVANTHTGNLYSVVVDKSVPAQVDSSQARLQQPIGGQQPQGPEASTAAFGFPQTRNLSIPGLNVAIKVEPQDVNSGQHIARVRELVLPKVPGKVSDTLLLDGVWFVNSSFALLADNYNNRVWGIEVGEDLISAKLACLIQLPIFKVPTTITAIDGRLWITNAHLDTCFPFLPCPHHAFEVIGVDVAQCKSWP